MLIIVQMNCQFSKKKYKLPVSLDLSKRVLSLPIFEELKIKEINYICKQFNEILK